MKKLLAILIGILLMNISYAGLTSGLVAGSVAGLIVSNSNSSEGMEKAVIDMRVQATSNSKTDIISKFCEEDNYLISSKYECYKKAFTLYNNSKNKQIILDQYKGQYEYLESQKPERDGNTYILTFIMLVLCLLIFIKVFF